MSNRVFRPEIAWPVTVFVLLLAGMGSALAVLFFSRMDGGAEVLPEYYSRGLAWDSTAREFRAVARLGWAVDLQPDERADPTGLRAIRLAITDSSGAPLTGLSIEVEASRPHIADPVSRVTAMPQLQSGVYLARMPVRETGLWDFTVFGRHGPESFAVRFRRELSD